MPSKKAVTTTITAWPAHAQVLAELGPRTREATGQLVGAVSGNSFYSAAHQIFPALAESLVGWEDSQAASVIETLAKKVSGNEDLELNHLKRWLLIHRNNAQAVLYCLAVEPPEELYIMQLLSTAGSQKLVFLANWQLAQREVVLKRFIGPESADTLLARELQPHPLSMDHPNIIETHLLKNSKGERFLVERRLPKVLNDAWRSQGIQEAANLLRDISSALAFLRDKQLIHGDVKPDNIGFEDGHYILLDFGICRPQSVFSEDVPPTGSLRTRAPELLLGESPHTYASDVWALAATVFNALVGRFPYFRMNEKPPRISTPEERAGFEKVLADRVRNEWKPAEALSAVPEPIRGLLQSALDLDPSKRPDASRLVKLSEKELAAFLPVTEDPHSFSPSRELQQLIDFLPPASVLALMPESQKQDLRSRLNVLSGAKGMNSVQKVAIEDLKARVAS